MSLLLLFNSSAFTPLSSPNLSGWWYMGENDSQYMTDDGGGAISQVHDLSGNDNHLTASGSNRPTFDTNHLQFSNDLMTADNTVSDVSEETVFLVLEVNASSNAADYITGSSTTNTNYKYGSVNPGSGIYDFFWGTKSTTAGTGALRNLKDPLTASNVVKQVMELTRSQANNFIEAYQNGYQIGWDTHTDGTLDVKFELGGSGTSRANDIHLYEAVWYDRALSASERSQVRSYLMEKHSIATAPAAFSGYNDFVKRKALAEGHTVIGDFTDLHDLYALIGDSQAVGLASKSNFTAANIKLYTDVFQYDQVASVGGTNWEALDSRNAASRNDQGNTQSMAGINVVLGRLIQAETSNDVSNLKYAVSGSHISDQGGTDWNVQEDGTLWTSFKQFWCEAMDERVIQGDIAVNDLGVVVGLGTNDLNDASEYNALEVNYQAMIDGLRALPGRTGTKGDIYLFELDTSSPTYATGLPIGQAAVAAVVLANSDVVQVELGTAPGDTIDNTHWDAGAYETAASSTATAMTS